VCKVVGAIEFSNLAHDICSVKIRKKWRGTFDRSMFKMNYSKLHKLPTLHIVFGHNFLAKRLSVPPLVDPRAVEIDILPTSQSQERQKVKNSALSRKL
jgi:hypothetical protein